MAQQHSVQYKADQEGSSSAIRHGTEKISFKPEESHVVAEEPKAHDFHQTLPEAAQILEEHQG